MECAEVQTWIFRKIDGELSESEVGIFDSHLAGCPSCRREYRLLAIPQRAACEIPPLASSPFFYNKVKLHIEIEAKGMAGWQLFWRLARQMIPALAGITLALLTVLVYMQLRSPKAEAFQDYKGLFLAEEPSHRLLAGEQGDITDASVLSAIAEMQPGD